MEEVKTEAVESQGGCESCALHAETSRENEEMSFAFLLAIMPVLTLTFFGQAGLL